MKSVAKKKSETADSKLGKSKLPQKTSLKKLVEDISTCNDSAYTFYYHNDVKEAENASKTLKKLNKKQSTGKYSSYKI